MSKKVGYILKEDNIDEILDKFYEDWVEIDWVEQYLNIDTNYRDNEDEIKKGIILDFENCCKKVLEYQNENRKGIIKYIQISFLRTSIIEGKSDYRIDFFDKNWYGDKIEIEGHIKFDYVFDYFFKYLNELKEKCKPYKNKITEMDIERISMQECDKYNILVIEYLKEIVEDFIKVPSYEKIIKDENLLFMAGEYMGEFEIIYDGKE